MPFLFPRLLVWQTFVRQRGQAKTGVGDSDALCVVGEHLGCDIDKWTCPHVHHLAGPLTSVKDDEAVNV